MFDLKPCRVVMRDVIMAGTKNVMSCYTFNIVTLQKKSSSPKLSSTKPKLAPGEARTHNLGMALCRLLSYKYRALTDCATGALY